ncbi:hypothetical protein I876_00665 [Alteromonas mediterranea U7]|nr:hypothetical protein I607_00650 [Alteromonas mediterranea U4]AGP88028.1 hypothetical protein I876_00665 [Alteromonas mediterranea U7]AGP91881.1 hypothetical protein I634_00655 [Alteromonas mediterranea U8]
MTDAKSVNASNMSWRAQQQVTNAGSNGTPAFRKN